MVVRRLAGQLLWLGLLASAAAGCFWPQDDQVFTEIPPKRNSPPRIIPKTVEPSLDTSYKPGCPNPFTLQVEDVDVADVIYNRWFVYQPGAKPVTYFDGDRLLSGTKPVRDRAITPPTPLFSAASELTQNGEHRVEVVIADGQFEGSTTETEGRSRTLADGGVIIDPTYIDSYVWIVRTSDTLVDCP
jgi:hypothetical protein